MVAFDIFLYVALGAGIALGHGLHLRPRILGPTTIATVAVLLGALGASLGGAPAGGLVRAVPMALLLLATTVGLTLLLVHLLPHRTGRFSAGKAPPPYSALIFVGALAAGFALGHAVSEPYALAVRGALYVLLFLVGLGMELALPKVREIVVPLGGAVGGAVGAGLVVAWTTGTDLRLALATTLGFGFYSLAGPLVAARLGADAGLVALVANFLREDVTILVAPFLGPRAGPEAMIALGGATSMDTTMYSVTQSTDPRSATVAVGCGLVLTLAATFLVPAALALPPP